MDFAHPLKAVLQLQLASDSSAALHLPYVLASVTSENFQPSPHLSKWTTRINSLLHSKDASGRWAGLCLATRTSTLSKSVMIECAQSWLGTVLPILSVRLSELLSLFFNLLYISVKKNEAAPVLKSSVLLLRTIFSTAIDVPEFQRQVSTPNVPKFTFALMNLAEKHVDLELKVRLLTLGLSRYLHSTIAGTSLVHINATHSSLPHPSPCLVHRSLKPFSRLSQWKTILPNRRNSARSSVPSLLYPSLYRRQSWSR